MQNTEMTFMEVECYERNRTATRSVLIRLARIGVPLLLLSACSSDDSGTTEFTGASATVTTTTTTTDATMTDGTTTDATTTDVTTTAGSNSD